MSLEYWIRLRSLSYGGQVTRPTALNMCSRSRGAIAPEVCMNSVPPKKWRAQGRPGARCTRGLVCNAHLRKRTRAYRFSGNTPAFPARWFYGLYVLALVRLCFCATIIRDRLSPLTGLPPASGRQAHTTSPYALRAHIYRTLGVHRIPTRVPDVAQRPSEGETGILNHRFGLRVNRNSVIRNKNAERP